MTGIAEGAPTAGPARLDSVQARQWRLLVRRPGVIVGLTIVGLMTLAAVLAPWIRPHGPETQVGLSFGPPSLSHPLGLNDGGIDMVSLLLTGAQVSMVVGFAAACIAVTVGGSIGLLAGYFGGWVDTFLMRLTDYVLAIPQLPLMIVVAAIWGSSLLNIILVIGLLSWAVTARVIRAQVLTLRERVYVSRARSLGAGDVHIIARHILPQLAPLLAAATAIGVADAIFAETGLAFLGLGDPNAVSWGKMIQEAFQRSAVTQEAWWAIVPPGLCVTLVVVACTLIGRGIEDALNPRLRVSHLAVRSFRIRPLVGRDREAA